MNKAIDHRLIDGIASNETIQLNKDENESARKDKQKEINSFRN